MSILVNLPKNLADFVALQVKAGSFASESDVIAEAVRLWAEPVFTDEETALIRELVQEGIDSGDDGPFDMDRIIDLAREEERLGLPLR
jgi:antitoxin ParD1/3/4